MCAQIMARRKQEREREGGGGNKKERTMDEICGQCIMWKGTVCLLFLSTSANTFMLLSLILKKDNTLEKQYKVTFIYDILHKNCLWYLTNSKAIFKTNLLFVVFSTQARTGENVSLHIEWP